MVSDTFISWLKKRGVKGSFITGETAVNRKWNDIPKDADEGDNHTAVKVGSSVIDFTAKQFDRSLPNPRIISVADFKKEWETVNEGLTEAKLPKHASYVLQRLKELKGSLYEHDLSNKQIQAALNHAFEPLMIKFKVVAAPMKQSQYVEAGLNGASYDSDGWITVALTDDVGDVLNGNASVAYEDFANLCNASIAHELTHRDQVLKHAGNMDGAKDQDRLRDYLSDHRELEAFAVQAVLELLSFWSPSDIISKMSKTSQLEHLAKWSDVLELYLSVFHNASVLQRLLKKMHAIASSLQDE